MEINIVTAEKNLTKSLVNQMRHASFLVLDKGEVMGFVINVVKDCEKAILIYYDNDYYTIPSDYVKSSLAVQRKIGRKNSSIFKATRTNTISFNTKTQCTRWWNLYQKVLKKAVSHIYV